MKSFCTLALIVSPAALNAQAGSVSFEINSFGEVTSIPEPYSDFTKKLFIYDFAPENELPSLLFLSDFEIHVEPADSDIEDSVPTYTLIAEYLGLSYDTINREGNITENGLIGLQIPIGDTDETVIASGDSVAGFIRTNSNPSSLGAVAAPGYIAGLEGAMSWDFQAAERVVLFEGDGASYDDDLFFSSFATLSHGDDAALLEDLDLTFSNFSNEQWSFQSSFLELSEDLTNTDDFFTFRGTLEFDFVPSDDTLTTNTNIDPDLLNTFRHGYYIFELKDDSDFDGDGIPDFVDLTGTNNLNAQYKPSHASEQHQDTNWFWSPLFETWFYSAGTNWDYSMSLGWIWDPSTVKSYDRKGFWFFIYTEPENANTWEWCRAMRNENDELWIYRNNDETWLYYYSTENEQSIFINSKTQEVETLNF